MSGIAYGETSIAFSPIGLSGTPSSGTNYNNYCGDSFVASVTCTNNIVLTGTSAEFEVKGNPSAMPTGLPSLEPTSIPSYTGIRVLYPDGSDLECTAPMTIEWYTQNTNACPIVDVDLYANDTRVYVTNVVNGLENVLNPNTFTWNKE